MDDIQNELRKLEEETFRRSSIMTDWKTPLEEEEEEESTDDDDSYCDNALVSRKLLKCGLCASNAIMKNDFISNRYI